MRPTKSSHKSAPQCWLSIVAGTFVIAICLEARAEPPHYRIDFAAPKHLPYCDDPEGFRGVLALALSRDLLEPPASRVLDVRVDKPNGGDYIVNIAIKELDGRVIMALRETHPRSMECFKVLHSAALAAALEIDKDVPVVDQTPQTTTAPASSKPPPCPICEKPPAPLCKTPPAPAAKPVPDERNWFVGLGGSTVLGAAPANVVGLQLAAGWKWARSWSIETNVRGTFPATVLPLDTTRIRVHSILSFAVAPCYRLKALGACVVATGANMWVEPLTLASSNNSTSQYLGVGPRVFVEKRLAERWSLRVDGEIVVPFMFNRNRSDSDAHWNSTRITGGANVSFLAWF